jgi:hypothetical protein
MEVYDMTLNKLAVGICIASISAAALGQSNIRATFHKVTTYQAMGGLMASTVAPGPAAGTQRLYASYLYADSTLDVIAIDPATGQSEVFHNVVPGEYGARNIAVGPDGDVYLGTLPHAHFIRIDRKAHTMVDLGQPAPGEEYIWDVAYGSDKRLYGVTYPGCKLVRYDPATAKLEDLGRMDPTEKYGRWIVGGHDRYMYIGIGTAKANIAVFDTETGKLREILPEKYQKVGIAKPYIGVDGKAYATLDDHLFAIDGFSIRELSSQDKVAPENHDILPDGTTLSLSDGQNLTEQKPNSGPERKLAITYKGEDLQVFRLGFGPDGALYGSSILPIHFFRVDLAQAAVVPIGNLGGGEIYSFLAHDNKLLMAAYSGIAPLMTYEPGKAFAPKPNGNPELIEFPNFDHAWRPQAMIADPDGRVYVGATAGYGKLEGPLLSWTGEPGSIEQFEHIVTDQSIVSLAATRRFIVGGTTTQGGGGSHPTAKDAHVVLWDPATKKTIHDTVIVGAETITDLVVSRKSGTVFGIAIHGADHTLFALDAATGSLRSRKETTFHDVVYNGVGQLMDGTIVGLASTGVFAIDEKSGEVRLIATSPEPITGGFAMRGDTIFFVSKADVYSVALQVNHAH